MFFLYSNKHIFINQLRIDIKATLRFILIIDFINNIRDEYVTQFVSYNLGIDVSVSDVSFEIN